MTQFTNYTRSQVAAICKVYGPKIIGLPPGVDGAQLLWAISGNESSFGVNCEPRLEPTYWTGQYSHDPAQAKLNQQYGPIAASSVGPWQLMAVNAAPFGVAPVEASMQIDKAAQATVGFLSHQLQREKPPSLEMILKMWNSGNWKGAFVPAQYIVEGVKNYGVALPVEGGASDTTET
jgi:hypothetical protein